MQRRYVFRADASPEIGAGHVMRLCSIIEEMLEHKNEVLLVGEIEGVSWLEKRVATLGNKLHFLRENEFISDPSRDVLVIDSYTLDPNSKFLANEKWHKIVALVEVGTPKYRADLYIHCGTNNKIELEYKFRDSKFIGGIRYLPIRKSMQKIKYRSRNMEKLIPIRIVIVGGGTDPFDFVMNMALELSKLDQEFEAILISDQEIALSTLEKRFIQKGIGANLESELVHSDLVLTLSGTSSWDFLSCGFPIGVALGFENQIDNFEFQTNNNLAIGIGKLGSDNRFAFNIENIKLLIGSEDLRMDLARKARVSIDSLGVKRIAKALVELAR
jgi:spore coat polysaccharide biosynthesis predicted glycosyltransferase SpsG